MWARIMWTVLAFAGVATGVYQYSGSGWLALAATCTAWLLTVPPSWR